MARHQPFRIGQITDLHARRAIPGSSAALERRSRDVFDLLPDAIDMMKHQEIDFLALTGDLVDVPMFLLDPNDYYPVDIDEWLSLVKTDYLLLRRMLDQGGLPYLILPGNHDLEAILWQVFDRSTHAVDVEQGYRLVRFCDREWRGHQPRRIDSERRLWMQMLNDEKSPTQIHLQHFVISPWLDEGYPFNYFESKQLIREMAASGRVTLSLSGHYHRGTSLTKAGACNFAVCPAFGEFPHVMRIYELNEDGVSMEELALRKQPIYTHHRIVFLDRDGVITGSESFRTGPGELTIIPDAARAIQRLRRAGFVVVVISNQTAVGAGHVLSETVDMVNEHMCQLLVEDAGDIDAQPDLILYAVGAGSRAVHPSLVDTSMNKPATALLEQAVHLLGADPLGAWMVGDRMSDLQAGRSFGATPILVRTGRGGKTEKIIEQNGFHDTIICEDLSLAVDYILADR